MKTTQNETLLHHIGMQLRRLKIANNKTSKEIAAILNITPQAYGNIERGVSEISITKLVVLAKFYKVSLLDLIPKDYHRFDTVCETASPSI